MEIESEKRYASILLLQEELNSELRNFFESNMDKGREFLSSVLVDKIESIVEDLNTKGFNFGRCDYAGDINYEDSEQIYSNGQTMGTGTILHFHGFSVQVSWANA